MVNKLDNFRWGSEELFIYLFWNEVRIYIFPWVFLKLKYKLQNKFFGDFNFFMSSPDVLVILNFGHLKMFSLFVNWNVL